MAAQGHQTQDVFTFPRAVLGYAVKQGEHRFAGCRRPDALGRGQWHTESAGHPDAGVKVLKAGKGLFNSVADAVVIGDQLQPVGFAVRQGVVGDPGDNGRF